MRSRTADWFECKVRYEKLGEDGLTKKVSELYTVDALNFTEAENRIIEEMSSYVSGAFEVSDIRKAAYKEVFFADSDSADRWYKAKIWFILLDEKSGKEKRQAISYLVNAGSVNSAVASIDEVMQQPGSTIDYAIASVAESTIMDVYEYRKADTDNKDQQ